MSKIKNEVIITGILMIICRLPADVWRLIARSLTKRDLVALQLTNRKLMNQLEDIGDIWWGKHLDEYQQRWNEYYNGVPKSNRDQQVENILLKMYPMRHCQKTRGRLNSKPRTELEIRKLLVRGSCEPDYVTNPWKYGSGFHQDILHSVGACVVCDSQYWREGMV